MSICQSPKSRPDAGGIPQAAPVPGLEEEQRGRGMGFTATKKGMSRCSSLQWPALACPIRLQCSKTDPEAAVQRGRFQRAMDDVVPQKRNRRRQRSKSTTGTMEEQSMGRSSKVSGVWPKAAGAQRPRRSVHAAAQLILCHRAVGFLVLPAQFEMRACPSVRHSPWAVPGAVCPARVTWRQGGFTCLEQGVQRNTGTGQLLGEKSDKLN